MTVENVDSLLQKSRMQAEPNMHFVYPLLRGPRYLQRLLHPVQLEAGAEMKKRKDQSPVQLTHGQEASWGSMVPRFAGASSGTRGFGEVGHSHLS